MLSFAPVHRAASAAAAGGGGLIAARRRMTVLVSDGMRRGRCRTSQWKVTLHDLPAQLTLLAFLHLSRSPVVQPLVQPMQGLRRRPC